MENEKVIHKTMMPKNLNVFKGHYFRKKMVKEQYRVSLDEDVEKAIKKKLLKPSFKRGDIRNFVNNTLREKLGIKNDAEKSLKVKVSL